MTNPLHPIEKLWYEHGLPEWFLGNGGTNTKLYALYDAILAITTGERAPSDRELYDNGCITRHQLKNWVDSDYASHIGGVKHTIEFLLTKLDTIATPPVVAGADREIVAWQYRCMFDKGSARQDEWCEWHITTQRYYDKIVDEIRSGRERVQVRALMDAKGSDRVAVIEWPEPSVVNPDIACRTGVPYIDSLIHRLLDAQQDINLAANEHMSQNLADASTLIDEIETVLRTLVDAGKMGEGKERT